MDTPSPEKIDALNKRLVALEITPDTLIEKFILGSGKGGQKVNKTANCVYLKHIPTGIEIKCQESRSRELNRFLAKRSLCDALDKKLNNTLSKKDLKNAKLKKQKKRRKRRTTQGTDPS